MLKEEEPYYKLKPPQMKVDFCLSKREIHPPFPNKSFACLLSGKPGSGKSSFLISILNQKSPRIYRKVFKNIIVVCPSLDSLPDDLLLGIPEEQKFRELSLDVKNMIEENSEAYKEEEDKCYSQLLILDDVTAYLKSKENVKFLNELFFNRRHLRLSIVLSTQYVSCVPKSIRANLSCVCIFKPTVGEYETIRREFMPLKKDKFNELMGQIFRDKYDNLFITENKEYFRNLGRLVILE